MYLLRGALKKLLKPENGAIYASIIHPIKEHPLTAALLIIAMRVEPVDSAT